MENPAQVAILPERIPFVRPKLHVSNGDAVKTGSVLFTDKRNPTIRFLSPGGGIVERIDFGPRRIVREIVVKLDATEAVEDFGAVSNADLGRMSREDVTEKLVNGGLWPLVRQLPFRDYADPKVDPPGIFVCLNAAEPFQAEPAVYLKGQSALFESGIEILRRLTRNRIYVTAPIGCFDDGDPLSSLVTHVYDGPYPAGDPGTLLYHIKQGPDENRCWYIDGQDLLLLAQLLQTGTYPTERTVALSGDMLDSRCHVKTRLGVSLAHVLDSFDEPCDAGVRLIQGGLLTGYAVEKASYLGFHETSLTAVADGRDREFLGFIRPGFKKPSYSKAFLSSLNPSNLSVNCGTHGEERACIACGSCNRVCPVDVLPQLTFKAVLADDVDESLSLGLLDCVECGLCAFVCPSKIELSGILKSAKKAYYLEQS